VTYHGPGQIVGYPVLDLSDRPDVRKYVNGLEEAMIRTCADFGVEAVRHPEHRGAWVAGRRKIGAVGVHLSRWITSHGFAFNVSTDLTHFQVIVPCGIADPRLGVTTLAAELARAGEPCPPMADVEARLAAHVAELFGRERRDAPFTTRTVSVVPVRADGAVLLLRRSEARGGFWQPVTGRIEPGESPDAAARRELLEETGADVAPRPLGYRHGFAVEPEMAARFGGGLVTVEETAYAALLPASFDCVRSDEHAEHEWLPAAAAVERLPYAGLRRAVRLALQTLSGRPAQV
jgi:lipoyl(octanoyl) transferase